jgi:Nif-specific regulatory protein
MSSKGIDNDFSIHHLREISTWVSSVQDLDQVLELIIETATRMMNAKASSLLLVDPKSRRLYFKVATGDKKDDVKQFEVELGQGIAGHVALTGEPVLIPDVRKDPRWYKEISESIGFKTRSIACVPMKINNEIIGVVEIIDKNDGKPIRKSDINILMVFTELAAMAIGSAREFDHAKRELKTLKEELGSKYQIIGDSQPLRKVISDAFKVANSKTSTLIVGESGTGKELLARLIHRGGSRKDESLVVLNCAALPETLLEVELFGHEKGAYTGAIDRKIGKFELADGGTIFLDEIAEMSPGMQAKLLRVLQESVFYRVGGNKPIHVDVRVIAATNKNIANETSEGRFREDLYYRLNVVQIHMPALRDRKEDIPIISEHFLEIFSRERGLSKVSLSKKAVQKIIAYHWPGNVRELRNALERAVVLGNGKEVLPDDLPMMNSQPKYPGMQIGLSLREALDTFKKEFIKVNLKHSNGSRSKAAKVMGIQRTYLSSLVSKYDLQDM